MITEGRNLLGYVDCIDEGGILCGWVADQRDLDQHLIISVWLEDMLIGRYEASAFRHDLRGQGLGQGDHAFFALLPPEVSGNPHAMLRVVVEDANFELTGSPQTVAELTGGATDEFIDEVGPLEMETFLASRKISSFEAELRHVDWSRLLARLGPEEFVLHAFWLVLRRIPAPEEVAQRLEKLSQCLPEDLIIDLVSKPEFKQRKQGIKLLAELDSWIAALGERGITEHIPSVRGCA